MEQGESCSAANVSIRIDDLDPSWVGSLNQKLAEEPKLLRGSTDAASCCIHRIPQCFRRIDPRAYEPQIVSIGPFHRGKRNLQAMEEHKWRYLRGMLSRNKNGGLEGYLAAAKNLEAKARDCYSETTHMDSNSFVEMMVLDGCFVVELLCKARGLREVEGSDPIFKMHWIRPLLETDLLLLENQIPFFVLERLFALIRRGTESKDPCLPFATIAIDFFKDLLPLNQNSIANTNGTLHLLHLFHSKLLPAPNYKTRKGEANKTPITMIQCATELEECGIRFRKRRRESFLEVRFSHGVMEIPQITVQDSTNYLFLNLAALEQSNPRCGHQMTTYITFMDCLIGSAKDVRVLCRNRIVENWLGSEAEVAALFNKLGREVTIEEQGFYLAELFREVNRYYRTDWHAWRASLVHDYFRNPWATLSLLAAVILLVLTFVQSFFAALAYIKPPPAMN
ncbi:hypothetical protein H6P81_002368 [Aristolochia fimbriata]|uniref:Uncharacterized protein n=1 Tax=Aristolochia fimbriata TaxID=158543 RepID=A0AAV7F9K5_ARIFI|nr:hypothetical protein H6P81_002368 [Aristolochia fimbriata]